MSIVLIVSALFVSIFLIGTCETTGTSRSGSTVAANYWGVDPFDDYMSGANKHMANGLKEAFDVDVWVETIGTKTIRVILPISTPKSKAMDVARSFNAYDAKEELRLQGWSFVKIYFGNSNVKVVKL